MSKELLCLECTLPICDEHHQRCLYQITSSRPRMVTPAYREQERQRKAKWKRDNKEKVNAINRAYRKRNRDRYNEQQRRRRAMKQREAK